MNAASTLAPKRAGLGSMLTFALALELATLAPAPVQAHHVPGHGSSEGVRSINSLGNRGGKVGSRLLLLNDFAWQPTSMTPGSRDEVSLLGEYAPLSSVSFGAQLPFTIVGEAGNPIVAGYGDTRAFLRFTPHANKLIHRTSTFNVLASFPTRTYQVSVDPGRVWSVTPSMIFTRTYGDWFWQAIALGTVETRPAGVAVDFSVGAQAGGKFASGKVALGGGVIVDTRAVNWCASPDGSLSSCNTSRPGEDQREPGSTRATALATGSVNFNPRWSLIVGVQVPFTVKRDVDFGLTTGVSAQF